MKRYNSGKNHFQSKALSFAASPELRDTRTTCPDQPSMNSDKLILVGLAVGSMGSMAIISALSLPLVASTPMSMKD
ncbi:MAG: hypothetical protein NZ777_01425, partial [Pseudomonadales bacterium]|nr:hypothetical protein [Pseudomonadales bacterium]